MYVGWWGWWWIKPRRFELGSSKSCDIIYKFIPLNRNGIGNCVCKSSFANTKGSFALPTLHSYQIIHLLRSVYVEAIPTIASVGGNVSSPPTTPSHVI